jgi:tetratricopeptide (TPR) repeat protein
MQNALLSIGLVWNDPPSVVVGVFLAVAAVLAVTFSIMVGNRMASRQFRAAAELAAATEQLDKGSAALDAGDPDLALSHANEMLRRWPDKPGGQLLRAEALCRKGQFRRALDDANEVVHRAPSPAAFRIRGEIHLGLEDYELALSLAWSPFSCIRLASSPSWASYSAASGLARLTARSTKRSGCRSSGWR